MKRIAMISRHTASVFCVTLLCFSGCKLYKKSEPASKNGTSYYIDSAEGNDKNAGTSPNKAWESLDRVNSILFAPGDKILFKAGSKYSGRLKPQGSGKKGNPISIDMYGDGQRPRIDAEGKYMEALLLYNAEYWEINNLEVTNLGPIRVNSRAGVRVRIENFGTAHNIHLKNLFVHEVNGSYEKFAGGGTGITCEVNDLQKLISRFDDLLIEGCHLKQVERDGIATRHLTEDYWHRDKNCPFSTKVIVRHNLLENLGGDGIVVRACDGALIEHNVIQRIKNDLREAYGGIWPFSSDNTIIQFNEVGHLRGTHDGYGYNSDYNTRNTVIQYNYSHDNEGGFVLVTASGKKYSTSWNIGNNGTIIRYNISVNDGYTAWGPIFAFTSGGNNIQIYNNVVYVSGHDINMVAQWTPYGKSAQAVKFFNNIFYVAGCVSYVFKDMDYSFNNNVFYGDHQNPPYDPNAITSDPMFVNVSVEPESIKTLDGYKLKEGSPCIGSGVCVESNGDRDFWGHKLPAKKKLDIGVHQLSR